MNKLTHGTHGSIDSGPIEFRASTYDPLALFLWARSTNPMGRPDCRRNLVDSLLRGMVTVVDESVEVRVRKSDGDTERKRQQFRQV